MNIKNSIQNLKINNQKFIYEILFCISLIIIGTFSRFFLVGWGLQPFPNFELIMVLTFIAVIFLKSPMALLVPIFSMIFSDILIGNTIFIDNQMNRIVLFTYSGFALISIINIFNKKRFKDNLGKLKFKNVVYAGGLGILFVLIYDIWTNFGWWFLMYPHTFKSLVTVYLAGIPFMIYHMISGVFTFIAIALPIVSLNSINHKINIPIKIKKSHKIIIIAITLMLVLLSFSGNALKIPEKSDIWLENSDETSVRIKIIGNDWELNDNIIAYEDSTVFTLLNDFSNRNQLDFEYTYYEQFDSILIDSIGNVKNGEDGKYWQYYIYNEIPMVGCDKYKINNGDYIEWRFEIIPY